MQPIALSLSGGGDRTFVLAGIVHYLKQQFDIKLMVLISGSSYSAPIALTAKTISSALSRINRFDIFNYVKEVPNDQILEKQGLFEIDPEMYDFIESLTGVKRGYDKLKNTIILPTAVNISKTDLPIEYLANVRYGLGVRASMAFPYLLTPIQIGRSKYLDGGLKGDYQTKPFNKFNKLPKIVLNIDSKITAGVLAASIRSGLKQIGAPITKLYYLKKLYSQDKVLQKITKHVPREFSHNANFIFNVEGLDSYNLLLTSAQKQTLFLKGYFLGETIASKIKYSLENNTWEKFSYENVYNVDINDTIISKIKKDDLAKDVKREANKKQGVQK